MRTIRSRLPSGQRVREQEAQKPRPEHSLALWFPHCPFLGCPGPWGSRRPGLAATSQMLCLGSPVHSRPTVGHVHLTGSDVTQKHGRAGGGQGGAHHEGRGRRVPHHSSAAPMSPRHPPHLAAANGGLRTRTRTGSQSAKHRYPGLCALGTFALRATLATS